MSLTRASVTDRAAQYAPESGAPVGLLFLDYVEATGNGQLELVFDFGDLDQLVGRLNDQGSAWSA